MLGRKIKWSCICQLHARYSRKLFTGRRLSAKNYYDVLGVKKESTQKEIRDAYVKLCKELHPDKQGLTKDGHRKFTELNHAYTVLSKPWDRKVYDEELQGPRYQPYRSDMQRPFDRQEDPFMHRQGRYYEKPPDYSSAFRHASGRYVENKQQKINIVVGCFVLLLAGACLHFLAYRYGTSKDMKERMMEASSRNWRLYQQSKDNHKIYGTAKQIERIFGDGVRENEPGGDGEDGSE
ncbi:dnaJ homolog subfamily C member 4 [Ixodes scapularis]|uniref:dnaJ homolog subfamily C member 4 n=1 Tax=Ixodes scapularis TaxID=6945 RepID=UPI001A9F16E0|nr:dnaJ homolog subfamily C member 4 [Ixodes scapularis]